MNSFAMTALFGPVLVASISLTFSGSTTAELQFPLSAPRPKVGDVAKFRTVDLWNNKELFSSESEVVEVRDDRWLMRNRSTTNPDARTLTFTSDLQPCRSMRNSDALVCGGALKFPMQIGNKTSYDKLPWFNGQGHSASSCEVKVEEKITLSVGVLDTVRVECSGFWTRVFEGGGSGRTSEVIWYSPVFGRVVKSQFSDHHQNGQPFNKQQTEMIEFVGAK